MKEIVYSFHQSGCYLADTEAVFAAERELRLIVKPHEFELKINDEVLRSSSCKGYRIEASRQGGVSFWDAADNLLAVVKETDKEFSQIHFKWQPQQLSLEFGGVRTVDYYPNCDGEYDRWGTEWVSEYIVSLKIDTSEVEIKMNE